MNLRGRRGKKNINLNPNIILYQGEAYKGLGEKNPKTTAFEYELSPTTLLLLYSVGIPNVTHLHIWAQTVIQGSNHDKKLC